MRAAIAAEVDTNEVIRGKRPIDSLLEVVLPDDDARLCKLLEEEPQNRVNRFHMECAAASLYAAAATDPGKRNRGGRKLAQDAEEHAGGVVDFEFAFFFGESDFAEGITAAHSDNGKTLQVVNAAGTCGKNP